MIVFIVAEQRLFVNLLRIRFFYSLYKSKFSKKIQPRKLGLHDVREFTKGFMQTDSTNSLSENGNPKKPRNRSAQKASLTFVRSFTPQKLFCAFSDAKTDKTDREFSDSRKEAREKFESESANPPGRFSAQSPRRSPPPKPLRQP